MAKIINEGTPEAYLSGRIGDIVIVKGKNGPFMRKRPKKYKVQESESLQRARHRFAMAGSFIKNAAHIVKLGTWPKATNAISQAMSDLLKHALTEDRGEHYIDYTKVVLSKGTAAAPKMKAIDFKASGGLILHYCAPKATTMGKELIVALYNPLAGFWDLIKGPWPGTGRFSFKPAAFDVLEAYAFVRHTDGSNSSRSIYLGSLSAQGF